MPTRLLLAAVAFMTAGALVAPVQAKLMSPAAAPQIDSVSPGMGGPGDRIEITGRGFSSGGQAPTVTFLGTPASVSAFTDSVVTVVVPVVPDPPDGFLEIKVATSEGFDIAPFRYYAAPPVNLGAPVGLAARALKGKVTLTWSPPRQGASTVTEYQWRSQLKGAAWSPWTKVGKGGADARQQEVKRIRPRQVYVFQVRAMAGATAGPAATTQVTGK